MSTLFLIYSHHYGRGRAFKDLDPEVVSAIFWSIFFFWLLLTLVAYVRWNMKLIKRRKERQAQQNADV